jgi:hypothetical protein
MDSPTKEAEEAQARYQEALDYNDTDAQAKYYEILQALGLLTD